MSDGIEIKYDNQLEDTPELREEQEETSIDIIEITSDEYSSELGNEIEEMDVNSVDSMEEGTGEEDTPEDTGISENIVTIDSDVSSEATAGRTSRSRRRNDGGAAATAAASEELNIKASIARQTVHHGKIVAVEDNTEYRGETTASAIVITQNYVKITIPFEEFWADTTKIIDLETVDTSTEDGRRRYLARKRQVLSRLLGISINFIIRGIDKADSGETKYIIGSRRAANNKLMREYFFANPTRYTIGETYVGTVVSVNRNTLALCWNGIDIPLTKYAITERYADNLNSLYQPGDKIEFKLLEVNTSDGKFGLKIDAKGPELAKARELHHLLSANSIVSGTITRVFKQKDATGRIVVYAAIDNLPIPCTMKGIKPSDFGMEFKKGDKVQIIVTDFYKNGFVGGICKRLDSGMPIAPGASFANY